MAGYGRKQEEVEPALAWSMALFCGVIATQGRVYLESYLYSSGPALTAALQGLAAVFGLLGLGLSGAMGEPLPENPRGSFVPLRLRACWGILGLTPPPGQGVRRAGALAALILTLYPFSEAGPFSLGAATTVALTGYFLKKPKDISSMDFLETAYMLGLAAMSLVALYNTCGETPGQSWRGVAALAAVTLLAGQRAREVCAARWAQLLPGLPPPPALDLSRYELSVERAEAPRPALIEGAEEQLVDSGSFRVDAAKMLTKLRSYQLTDPRDFICAWLRCAAASGAESITLTTYPTGLELAFDGRPFKAAQLAQPYQALVEEEGADGKRNRHFAYGLLGLYRLKPKSVSVTSRGEDGVAAMNAGAGKAPDPEKAPAGTVIRVNWPLWAYYWRPALVAKRARERYGMGPAGLSIDGRTVPDRPETPGWKFMRSKEWRAWRFMTAEGFGRTRLYVLGTLIEALGPEGADEEVWLAHDGLELDISQSSVVRGKTLDEGLKLVGAGKG